ncbi:response regulator [Spongiibacter sp. KMU-158]|uniref:Response regulator n=1 Tax=Spongiibacter pelagi TaxID=2760804 RepID=A0A927BYF9_9GAMM|nr:response regulator [Spongiibacter pelagi]MBD2857865.1 response regulator [Spongiibacter pelagi]
MTAVDADQAKVLFVDDEPRILVAMKALFRNTYEVFTANSGSDALEVLRSQDIDVIVSDQRMPEMNGVEFLRTARTLRPRAIRILLTGYSDLNAILGAINEGEIFRYINKPWSNNDLRQTIADAATAARTEGVDVDDLVAMSLDADSGDNFEEAAAKFESAESEPKAESSLGAMQRVDAPVAPKLDDVGILILDDDADIRESLKNFLGVERHVYCASGLDEALGILEQHRIGVLITELIVDGEAVTDLLSALREHHPSLVAIVLSAQADAEKSIELINCGQVYRFLSKPVSATLLRGSINLAARRFDILQKNPDQAQRLVAEKPKSSQREDRRGLLGRIGRIFGLAS